MSLDLVVAAGVVAVGAAVRSTWSPCGLSMLSSITPLTERAKGHRFGVTASWFIAGAVVGGTLLGALAALLAAGWHGLHLDRDLVRAVAAIAAVAAGAVDLGLFPWQPPFFHRQVDDAWLRQYRPWVYGAGFGLQIGAGLATYIMTSAVVLTLVLAAMSGSPWVALGIGAGFGLVRGLAVLLGARATTPAALQSLHARFDAWEAPVRVGVGRLLLAVSVGLIMANSWRSAVGWGCFVLVVDRQATRRRQHRTRKVAEARSVAVGT